MQQQVQILNEQLNAGQQNIFSQVIGSIMGQQPQKRLVMVHGEGGCGKTFLYERLKKACDILVKIK